MMFKRRRMVVWVVLLACVIFLGFLFWKPLAVELDIMRAERMFRGSYKKDATGLVLMTNLDWTYMFAGTCGLSRMRGLASDPSIGDEGKEKLKILIRIVENGAHMPYFESWRGDAVWPTSAFQEYVIRCNEEHFAELDAPP